MGLDWGKGGEMGRKAQHWDDDDDDDDEMQGESNEARLSLLLSDHYITLQQW